MDVMNIRRNLLLSILGGGDMGLVLPSWIQAGIITVETTGNTLSVQHSFGRIPSDAYLIHLKQDYTSTSVADIMNEKIVSNLKERDGTNYLSRHGDMHNYGLTNGGNANASTATLAEMNSTSVTFGKYNNYSVNFKQGEQYLYIICDRNLPGDT